MQHRPPARDAEKFTFVIPAYEAPGSGGRAFARCLDSLEHQTDMNFNVVVVLDGPNETIASICDNWRAAPLSRYVTPHRGIPGGPHAVAFGIQTPECRGEFTTILNGDNTIARTYVEDLYSPDADVLLCMVRHTDNPGIVTDGTSIERGRIDRLNYSIRTTYARRGKHSSRNEQDWDFLQSCLAQMEGRTRFHHVEKILGTHN